MSPKEALIQTAQHAAQLAQEAGLAEGDKTPFLITNMILLAQQAAALALTEADDHIPAQAGATELILRAASAKHLPQPFTLPFSAGQRQNFDRLVLKRNAFMHPRGQPWQIDAPSLKAGLDTCCALVRHLLLTQPFRSDMLSPDGREIVSDALDEIASLSDFLVA